MKRKLWGSFYNQLELLVILIVMAFLHVYELGEKKNIVFWLKNWGCFFFLKAMQFI